MRLLWSPSASSDLDAIQRYIAKDSIGAAGRMRNRLESAAKRLLEQPMMGREGKAPGTREFVVVRAPYILVYRPKGEVVQILRVIHGAQNWPPR